MTKYLSSFVVCLLSFMISASLQAGTVELGAEDGAGPWGDKDGHGAGNEIVLAAYKAAGMDIKLNILSYAKAKALTLEGKIAGCFSMAWEPELEGKIVFAKEPLYTPSAVFFKNTKHSLKAKNIDQIEEKSVVGTVIDYEYPEAVVALKKRGVKFEEGYSEEANLKKLVQNRYPTTVAMIDELKSSDFLIQKAGVKGLVEVAFIASKQGSFVGFSLNHPDGKLAKAKFDEGYALIKKNGTLEKILKKWRAKQK